MRNRRYITIQNIANSSRDTTNDYRRFRDSRDLEEIYKTKLEKISGKSIEEILNSKTIDYRTEKMLYMYFIASMRRLKKLYSLSKTNRNMSNILNKLCLNIYLYTCEDNDNYSETMTLKLNILFNKQIRYIENLIKEDVRVKTYIKEKLELTDRREINERDFEKKYIHDGIATLKRG